MEQHMNLVTSFPNSSITHFTSSPIMDTETWSRLPYFLLERVVSFLPPPAFCRFRAVSKRWYRYLVSNSFLEKYMLLSPSRRWFLFFKRKPQDNYYIYNSSSSGYGNCSNKLCEGYLYDPCERTWYRLTFPMLPPRVTPVATCGGLVTWISDDPGYKSLIVCNPITHEFAQLPATLTARLCPSVGLVATDNVFHVMVAGDNLIHNLAVKNITTESFHVDRTTGLYSMWSTTSELPRSSNFESGRMVFVEGVFYCMSYKPFFILAQDTSTGSWSKIKVPMKRFLRSPSLVECRGRLLLVAAVEKAKLVVARSLRVWALRNDGTWGKVEVMPQQIYEQFIKVENGKGFECIGHGDCIAMTVNRSDRIILFNVCRKVWEWIPPCPFLYSCNDELRGFAYEPRPDTLIMGVLVGLIDQYVNTNLRLPN